MRTTAKNFHCLPMIAKRLSIQEHNKWIDKHECKLDTMLGAIWRVFCNEDLIYTCKYCGSVYKFHHWYDAEPQVILDKRIKKRIEYETIHYNNYNWVAARQGEAPW